MITAAGATEPRTLVDAFFPRSSVCRGQAVSLSLALCGIGVAVPGRNCGNSSFMHQGEGIEVLRGGRLSSYSAAQDYKTTAAVIIVIIAIMYTSNNNSNKNTNIRQHHIGTDRSNSHSVITTFFLHPFRR